MFGSTWKLALREVTESVARLRALNLLSSSRLRTLALPAGTEHAPFGVTERACVARVCSEDAPLLGDIGLQPVVAVVEDINFSTNSVVFDIPQPWLTALENILRAVIKWALRRQQEHDTSDAMLMVVCHKGKFRSSAICAFMRMLFLGSSLSVALAAVEPDRLPGGDSRPEMWNHNQARLVRELTRTALHAPSAERCTSPGALAFLTLPTVCPGNS